MTERDACPVGAAGAELVGDDELPYVVLLAGALYGGAQAVADRAAEYRAIFAGVAEGHREVFGRAFVAYCEQ